MEFSIVLIKYVGVGLLFSREEDVNCEMIFFMGNFFLQGK